MEIGGASSRNREYWDRAAGDKRFTLPVRADWMTRRLARDARMLDFGCGYGRTLGELAEAGFTHLAGMDLSAEMLRKCRSQLPAVPLVQCDGQRIPLANGSLDAVLLVAVITSIPAEAEQRALLEEILRVLRPGGLLHMCDFLLNDDARNLERYAQGESSGAPYGVFRHAEGIMLRHHRPEWIAELTLSFDRLDFEVTEALTMNGNRATAFQYLGRKSAG